MTKAKQPTTYIVEFTIIVDHPEKRCETLPKVFAGTFINTSSSHQNQASAVKAYREIVQGEWDFGSEYVSRVRVIAKTATASPRVVRGWKLRGRLDKTAASMVV